MFCYMERDTDSTAVWVAKSDFNIDLMPFHIFAENPHLSHLIEGVHNWSFWLVYCFICNAKIVHFQRKSLIFTVFNINNSLKSWIFGKIMVILQSKGWIYG